MTDTELFTQRYNDVKFPNKADFMHYNVYKDGKVIFHNATVKELQEAFPLEKRTRNILAELKSQKYLIEESFGKEAHKAAYTIAYQQQQMIEREFKLYLIDQYVPKELVTTNKDSKVERCYNLAYEYGHSSGFSDVEYHFSNFVDLLQ